MKTPDCSEHARAGGKHKQKKRRRTATSFVSTMMVLLLLAYTAEACSHCNNYTNVSDYYYEQHELFLYHIPECTTKTIHTIWVDVLFGTTNLTSFSYPIQKTSCESNYVGIGGDDKDDKNGAFHHKQERANMMLSYF